MWIVALYVHSYLRWIVLLIAVAGLVLSLRGWLSGRPWARVDDKLSVAFVAAVDTQVLFGLLLYVTSPLTRAAFAAFGAAMKEPTLRFFAVEHTSGMLLALVAAHVGRVMGKKRTDGPSHHRVNVVAIALFLFLVLGTMPWPGAAYGRPLFRVG